MDREQVEKLVKAERQRQRPLALIKMIRPNRILIGRRVYQLVLDQYHSFNLADFRIRYCPAFKRYDYLLGDYSYGQLRLTGFYHNDRRVINDFKISHLVDYLDEDCNFGALYYVLKKVNGHRQEFRSRNSGHRSYRSSRKINRHFKIKNKHTRSGY